jgi:chromosome segregation ATPase
MNQGGPGGPDADNIENIGDPQFLPADHALYKRLQAAFERQLTDEYNRVKLEYLDKANTLKALDRDKEDVGVQLYGLQQQLADMQLSFETAHENFNNIAKTRADNEAKLASLSENLEFRKNEIADLTKKVERASEELSKLNLGLILMKDHNHELKNELKLTQRTTHRTEENIMNLEKEKKAQDFLIDQYNEQIKRLTEQIKILDAQTIAQKGQTEEANIILNEATIEMDKILKSKKNLLDHYKKALFEIQDKDKNLQKLKDTLKIDEETNIKITSEISGIEKEIRDQNEQQATLGEVKSRMDKVRGHYQSKNQKMVETKIKIDARNRILEESLKSTQFEMTMRDKEIESLQEQIKLIEKNIMKLHMETMKKQEEIIGKISTHKTVSKTTINLRKQTMKLQNDLEEKEIDLAKQENEMARINIDILNTENQIIALEERKKEVNKDKLDHEDKVNDCEKRIKENHEVHEKKMHDVAKYNREHDKAMQKQTIFSKGPSDAKLIHLTKECEEIELETKNKKGEFIKEQTLYVKREEEANKMSEDITELKRKGVILEQKRLRLSTQYDQHCRQIKQINTNLKNFENDMNKLNELLATNYEKSKDLQNDNINIDSEIIQKLKEMEKESVNLEVQIDRLKESKAELLQEIVEAERQILLWERNIQLEKEMQEKLDPEFDQNDIQKMKKTIHLLEMRLEETEKQQKKLIIEMERIVYKKESIQLKYANTKNTATDGNKNPTQIAKDIQALKTSISESAKGLKEMDNNLRTKENELKNIKVQIENTSERINSIDFELNRTLEAITQRKVEHLISIAEISSMQKRTRGLEDIKKTSVRFAPPNQKAELDRLKEENQRIQDALLKFVEDNPKFSNILASVAGLQINS